MSVCFIFTSLNAKIRTAVRQSADLLICFLFVLGHYFNFVVVAAISANFMRLFQFMTMRTFNERGSRSLIVCKSLIGSALGLFPLGYCHFITPLLFLYLGTSIPLQSGLHNKTPGWLISIASSTAVLRSILIPS